MEDGLPACLLAFVTLETALVDELLSLGTDGAVVAVGKLSLMCLVDGMPLGADVNTTRQADLAARLEGARSGAIVVAVHHDGERRPSVLVKRGRGRERRHFRGDSDLVGLSRAACQGQIGLFVILHVELEGIRARLRHSFVHPMDRGLGRQVVLAPNAGRHGTGLAVEGDNPGLIPARALDRRHVKPKDVAGLMGTLNVHRSVAVMALNTSTVPSFADLAHFRILSPRNQGNAFAGTEGLGVAKLDLGRPDCTGDVHPVVVRGPLEGFAGVDRAI